MCPHTEAAQTWIRMTSNEQCCGRGPPPDPAWPVVVRKVGKEGVCNHNASCSNRLCPRRPFCILLQNGLQVLLDPTLGQAAI